MNDGGPAFPKAGVIGNQGNQNKITWWDAGSNGMSLRDYFAAKAMEAMICAPPESQMANEVRNSPQKAAEWAYQYADAMLAERSKKP